MPVARERGLAGGGGLPLELLGLAWRRGRSAFFEPYRLTVDEVLAGAGAGATASKLASANSASIASAGGDTLWVDTIGIASTSIDHIAISNAPVSEAGTMPTR